MKTSLVAILFGLLGCSSGGGAKELGPLEYTRLGELGVEAEIPKGSIDSRRKNASGTLTIESQPKVHFQQERSMDWSADVAAAKADIEKHGEGTQFTRQDVKDDGSFHLEYTFKNGSRGVLIRRKLGDKLYDCGTLPWKKDTVKPEQLASAIKICESLRLAR